MMMYVFYNNAKIIEKKALKTDNLSIYICDKLFFIPTAKDTVKI